MTNQTLYHIFYNLPEADHYHESHNRKLGPVNRSRCSLPITIFIVLIQRHTRRFPVFAIVITSFLIHYNMIIKRKVISPANSY